MSRADYGKINGTDLKEENRFDIRNSAGFEEIYNSYGKRILNLAFRMTSSQDEAQDLTQEIFIKVYERLDSFRENSSIYTWIYRIAVNHILNYLKKEKRKRWVRILDLKVPGLADQEEPPQPDFPDNDSLPPDKILEISERDKIINSIIDSLHPKYKVPFVLFRIEGMSYKEIADSMDLSLSAVEARIHRAKKQLIKKIEPWLKHF